jgi:hypothetical protein
VLLLWFLILFLLLYLALNPNLLSDCGAAAREERQKRVKSRIQSQRMKKRKIKNKKRIRIPDSELACAG